MQVTLPERGEAVTQGTVAKGRKQPGVPVREGEALVEVTTDKGDAEVPAPPTGKLVTILADAGQTISVGAPLAEIEVGAGGGVSAPKPTEVKPAPEAAPKPTPPDGGSKPATVEVSEGAELLARARGIDLAAVKGSGPGGSIRRRDVAEAIEQKAPTLPSPASRGGKEADAPAPAQSPTGAIPLRGAAAALVKYMEESREVPTATSFRTLRVDVLDQRRRQLNQGIQNAGRPEKLSYTHLVAFAIIRAVKDVPSMAVTFDRVDGTPARVARGVHLGLAVDVQRQDGSRMLLVPVIRDADRLDFAAFRDQYETLVSKARLGHRVAVALAAATIRRTDPGGIGTIASVPRLINGQGPIVAAGAHG